MSGSYKDSPERVRQFLNNVSSETKALNIKILGYADRAGRITRRENPAEFDAIVTESAADLELFAQRIEGSLPDYQRNLKLVTEGFEERIKSLDRNTTNGSRELQDMNREARGLSETAAWVKSKVEEMRIALATIRDSNYDNKLTQAASRVVNTAERVSAAFGDLETFALNISFLIGER